MINIAGVLCFGFLFMFEISLIADRSIFMSINYFNKLCCMSATDSHTAHVQVIWLLMMYWVKVTQLLHHLLNCKMRILRWVHTCTVTAYRHTVSWECGWDLWPCNVSKVGYAGTLRVCSVCCRYLAVASKGWCGYDLSRSGCAMWHVTTVWCSRLLYVNDASGSCNKLGTPWCNARRILLRHEARDENSDHNSVSCQSLATLQRYGTW
jgi:hypothetical protein